MADRSSRPHTSPRLTAARLQLAAKVLRRQQWTCGQIGAALEVSAATVARVLRRCGLSRRGRLTAPLVAQRYEHAAVGDLLHCDSKKPGRIRGLGHRIMGQRFHQFSGAGWEYLHVAVDDHSRVACVGLLPDEGQVAARRFLRGAMRWFRAHGVRVRRIGFRPPLTAPADPTPKAVPGSESLSSNRKRIRPLPLSARAAQ